ncbi:DEAD/DEAH box helicase [Bacillus rubiinfantis]|uniref:DEAD/DEAH box helicase n=1 Tax=Bacillus rubiinfantis TaxID=1499680 RepID=UPI0005AAB6E0|nr:DEAD/DEAH box helicase [Bacillus rubiinfantis]
MTDNDKTIEYLKSIRSELASAVLPPSFAKLYSQYTRLSMKQPGLKGWRDNEFSNRLADAITLIDAGLSERELGIEEWRNTLKRSGELLEWLSHPDLNVDRLPLRLLSAGVYQLAGYPALSMGLLNSEQSDSSDSQILIALLKADFPKVLDFIIKYWGAELSERQKRKGVFRDIDISNVNSRVVDEIVKSIGILCAYMRWEDNGRLEKALQKLRDMSDIMIYGTDNYSWLLSKIVSEVVREYVTGSMRGYVRKLKVDVSDYGGIAFERYLRSNYKSCKSLAWYSQVRGIERLLEEGSFALCTPTGSGKTTIAELAIIQSMFQKEEEDALFSVGPIVMYLVPSRALATEVESKLGIVLGNLGVKVTGLYGGTDWGPTDAWVTTPEPTVLICTYEKAEALIRFLGPLFLNRVSLVVIDEAHSVQFNGISHRDLISGDNRSLRLEMLTSRLLQYIENKRIIALSAVADENDSLAHWISGNEASTPVISDYRSTRQLVGRLEWTWSGQYEIRFDILNGQDLVFNNDGNMEDVPYIQNPFSRFPIPFKSLPKKFINEKKGVSKRQRPFLFWAAMQLAQPDEQGRQHSVLISITQYVGGYAEDFLFVLNKTLANENIPNFFTVPSDSKLKTLFNNCLASCADYFGKESNEYQLLEKGIVVHHGNMPGLLARMLIELVQKRVIFIVLATSTLSEGVNLPFETVLLPTLIRNQEPLSVSEFKNLIGRAGRPGFGTEGRTLVFLESRPSDYSSKSAHSNYKSMVVGMTKELLSVEDATSKSPLGALMSNIATLWMKVSGSRSIVELIDWLEKTVPLENSNEGESLTVEEALDSLDGFLLSILVEFELTNDEQMNSQELEQFLIEVWRKTYARYAMSRTHVWERFFSTRGRALKEKIYPDKEFRRRLYRTSVAPRFGKKVIEGYSQIQNHLNQGINYSAWDVNEKLQYIFKTVDQISNLEKFNIPDSFGREKNPPTRNDILTWWLNPRGASRKPKNNQISDWIKFIKKHFEYKFNWGIGTVLGLILDDVNDGILKETSIEEWPKTGLPWIVFWIKELVTWGTLDPVAALLLAHGVDNTRSDAETRAREYYKTCGDIAIDEILDPRKIKEWSNQFIERKANISFENYPKEIKVSLTRDFSKSKNKEWRVLPIVIDNSIIWTDPAGHEFAKCKMPNKWHDNMRSTHDFLLNIESKTIKVSKFL